MSGLGDEIEFCVVGKRCIYINNHRVAGGKPYVSENIPQHIFKSNLGEILDALPELTLRVPAAAKGITAQEEAALVDPLGHNELIQEATRALKIMEQVFAAPERLYARLSVMDEFATVMLNLRVLIERAKPYAAATGAA